MKTIILFFLLLPLIGNGQKYLSTKKLNDWIKHDTLRGVYVNGYKNNDTIYIAKPDTIKVLMLVSDTTCYSSGLVAYKNGKFIEDPCEQRNTGFVWWIRGYKVYISYLQTKYLNTNKKPLKSGIIVWQIKHIEK